MSHFQLNMEIHAALGWVPHSRNTAIWVKQEHVNAIITPGLVPYCCDVPNYAGDLNACHEVAMQLEGLVYMAYHKELTQIVSIANSQPGARSRCTEDAEPRQRAEALLEVLG